MFQLAQDHHEVLERAIVADLRARGDTDPAAEFDRRYEKLADGTTRSRREGFDGTQQAAVFIGKSAPISDELKRRVLSVEASILAAGRLLRVRFVNTWMIMPENISVQFWPAHPNDVHEAASDVDWVKEEYYTAAAPAKNPSRQSVWIKPNIDPTTKDCVVTLSTPIYDGDRFLGILGHDILLSDLVRRVTADRMEGTYNLLLRDDGYLIAHPRLVKAIEDAAGAYNILDSGDRELESIYRTAKAVDRDSAVVESVDDDSYLGVTRIPGPGWLLVTVYPRALVEETAYGAARIILVGGLIALLIELAFFHRIFREHVAKPLRELLSATRRIESGDLEVQVAASTDDELGRLTGAFNSMAAAVRDREEAQAKAIQERQLAEEEIQKLNVELQLNLSRLNVAVDALSTPVLEVWQDVLALPLIGGIDEERSAKITERLLDAVVRTQSRFVIIDVTGVEVIDTATAHRVLKVVSAVELLGARCVLTGVRSSVAQALVDLGADFGTLNTLQTLKHGLRVCLTQMSRTRPLL